MRNASRDVLRNWPSSASFGAKATEWSNRCSFPKSFAIAANTASRSPSRVTSQGCSGVSLPNAAASSSTFSRSRAPASAHAWAMAHAMDRWLATPKTRPSFPSSSFGVVISWIFPRTVVRKRRQGNGFGSCPVFWIACRLQKTRPERFVPALKLVAGTGFEPVTFRL